MIKISALNFESEEESGELEVTKEALEQIALQQYAKALDLQRKGNLKDATQLLKDLLETELLDDVNKPAPGEKVVGPLLNLKYSCYKNLAAMLSAVDDFDGAIEAFLSASELDDTDITLWHRMGLLCMRAKRYELALNAFQRGEECNPRHWPCLDKIVTLLLGLDYKELCISTIHDALQLDPGYLRGLVYRKHIYTTFPYIKDFMAYLNPIYKWNEEDDEPIDVILAEKLLKEAEDIHTIFLEQQRALEVKYVLPPLKMQKPISNLAWSSVGESLIHTHEYMTENCYSHACPLEVVFEKAVQDEVMEVCDEPKQMDQTENLDPVESVKPEEPSSDENKNTENISENENNDMSDKDKAATDVEKVESDVEMVPANDATAEPKQPKKNPVRRRGSALSNLRQWSWCYKRRSGRSKPINRQDQEEDNIYDTLRKMVPVCLVPEIMEKKENQARESSPDITDLDKLFEEKEEKLKEPEKEETVENNVIQEYFGTENEQTDVKQFIDKYTEKKSDIIDMLRDFLSILASKWSIKWPEGLSKIFIKANTCYSNHIDIPACNDDNQEDLLHYTNVNILVEEFLVNEKLQSFPEENNTQYNMTTIETISINISSKPHLFPGSDCMELMLRHLWVKHHIHMLNKCEELALDCMNQLLFEFEAMSEHCESYTLNVVNFTFKPVISETEILSSIKFLERNQKLSTVMDLFDRGDYEEVISIIIDSFDHCKNVAKQQEEEMSLDFAVQLALILDTYCALNRMDCCFKWCFICLHESLKHYFRYTTGSPEYEKWTLTVVKILFCMDHILSTEGLSCLEEISRKELSQGLDDLIRVIGHQVETNSSEMPFGTVIPWIIMHYILQREEDQGRGRTFTDKDKVACDEVPNPLMVLFIAHEQLGNRGWCCKSDGKLLYFILDTVVPRLRSPALAKSLETVTQYMEQCVYCLYGHPGKKHKLKYLVDHNVTNQTLDWKRAQQIYEIFRPSTLPRLEGKVPGITSDSEQLFNRILALLPPECDPQKYLPELDKYIKGTEEKLLNVPPLLPYKMKDVYFLLGDYYFKKEEYKYSIKSNMTDIIVNNDRLESWAQISLAKAVNIVRILNSCKNINNEKDFLNPARSVIRCFKRALDLDPKHCTISVEYGIFVYIVHSFCSRLLKQASESLSMEDFESLEKQKEDMLNTTQKCFTVVLNDLNNSSDSDREESWLYYYMLGKVAEKKNKPPSVYLNYYMQGVKLLQESNATYPLKIAYNSPTHLCIEVLEFHYRIHASILKYIEQHENKPIPASVGKVFSTCIDEWKKGPFSKFSKKDGMSETEPEVKPPEPVHAANILKRSVSDAGEEETHEAKRLKLEAAAAKVRRSASYDTERLLQKETSAVTTGDAPMESNKAENPAPQSKIDTGIINSVTVEEAQTVIEVKSVEANSVGETSDTKSVVEKKDSDSDKKGSSSTSSSSSSDSSSSDSTSDSSSDSSRDSDSSTKSSDDSKPLTDEEIKDIVSSCLDALEECTSRFPSHYKAIYRLAHYHFYYKKGKDIERCRDLMLSTFNSRAGQKLGGLFNERRTTNFFNNIWKIPVEEIDRAGSFAFHMSRSVQLTMEILKEIDDHKALHELSLQLQRIPDQDKTYLRDSDREELAQQAFSLCLQSMKGLLTKFSQQADLKTNDVERQALKSLTLDIFRTYQKSLKCPQQNSKLFINLLIEAYKLVNTVSIADNVNYADLSLKYCQTLMQEAKNKATQACLERQNTQKKQASKPVVEPVKHMVIDSSPAPSVPKVDKIPATSAASGLPKMSPHEMAAAFQNYIPMLNESLTSQQTAAALSLSYLNNISALGYAAGPLRNTLQSTLQNTLQNTFQAEFFRQFLNQALTSTYSMPPAKKQKRGPKPTLQRSVSTSATSSASRPAPVSTQNPPRSNSVTMQNPPRSMSTTAQSTQRSASSVSHSRSGPISGIQIKPGKGYGTTITAVTKATPTPVITSLQKSASAPLAPSMGTVLPSLPASMTANLTAFGSSHLSSIPSQAHLSSAATVNAAIHTKPPLPHQQVSPGKTLQEKLAERQKNIPISKSNVQDINASISKLPSSLTITKTSIPKTSVVQGKKPEAKKFLPFSDPRPKQISDEVIVLDDDD